MCRDAWGAYDIIWLHDIACVYRRSLNTKVLLTSCICTSSAWQAFPQLSLGFHRCPLKRWDVRNWALRSLNLALLFWTETHTETTEIKVSTVKSTVNSCIFKELRSQKNEENAGKRGGKSWKPNPPNPSPPPSPKGVFLLRSAHSMSWSCDSEEYLKTELQCKYKYIIQIYTVDRFKIDFKLPSSFGVSCFWGLPDFQTQIAMVWMCKRSSDQAFLHSQCNPWGVLLSLGPHSLICSIFSSIHFGRGPVV